MAHVLLITDNEGCLTPGKGRAYDLPGLIELQNQLALRNDVVFTIATGRPASYVEALVQANGCQIEVPVVCEGGATLYDPKTDRTTLLAPPVPAERLIEYLGGLPYRIEPGKQVCVSFYPEEGSTVLQLAEAFRRVPGLSDEFTITTSAAAVDITPLGVDKAFGVKALRARLEWSDSVAGFGDGENDLPLFAASDRSGCPSNAAEPVKQRADFVSERPHVWGLIDYLNRL